VLAGKSLQVSLDLSTAPASDLTFRLDGASPYVQAPSAIMIPAGKRTASFSVQGLASGVADLSLTPDSALYETTNARVQVRADAAPLHFEPVSGASTILTPGVPSFVDVGLRLVDDNLLPYAGLVVRADADGTVQPAQATTDTSGVVHFQWNSSTSDMRLLTARLADRPATAVEVAVLGPPLLTAAGVVNAASFAAGLVPGGFATLFGFNLWSGSAMGPLPEWPTSLDSVRVTIDGQPAQILITSLRQANILVPESVRAGNVTVVVENAYGSSNQVTVAVAAVQPGLFYDAASGRAAARQVAGRYFELYGTGFGTATAVDVDVAGLPARVLYNGPTPGIPGLHQVNIELPAALGPGEYALTVRAGGVSSNTVKLNVQ
jgi:uncharacterized protein (TIGR03437 family)